MPATCDAFTIRFTPPLRRLESSPAAPLAGLTVGVKDNFDIAGAITGSGNPEYAADHPPARETALVVDRLLDAGAIITGKTQMDELAYSLMGLNARYGAPLNPAAPDRAPGGSSSGSAVATASGQVEIGLGTDTGGSVRLPASFCGLFGWRSSHGLIPATGLVPLAPSYDTTGFFTRDLATMRRVMTLFTASVPKPETFDIWLPADLWAVSTLGSTTFPRLARPNFNPRQDPILPAGGSAACLDAFRLHQGYEIWQIFGDWITRRQPDFGPGIRERFAMASKITSEQFQQAATYRQSLRAHLAARMRPNTILIYPTAPGPAPSLTVPPPALEIYRNRSLSLMALAGHAGLPQLSLPLGQQEGAPIGLSLVASAGYDILLADAAAHLFPPDRED